MTQHKEEQETVAERDHVTVNRQANVTYSRAEGERRVTARKRLHCFPAVGCSRSALIERKIARVAEGGKGVIARPGTTDEFLD
jgi:hypothetical protein